MKKTLLTLAAVAMSAAMMAAPYVETYNFGDATSSAEFQAATVGDYEIFSYTSNSMRQLSFGGDYFGYRFAVTNQRASEFKFRHSVSGEVYYYGLANSSGYNGRYIAILNLNVGDKVSIKWLSSTTEQGLIFDNYDMIEGLTAESRDIVSEQEYTVNTAGNLVLNQKNNTQNAIAYIREVKITLAETEEPILIAPKLAKPFSTAGVFIEPSATITMESAYSDDWGLYELAFTNYISGSEIAKVGADRYKGHTPKAVPDGGDYIKIKSLRSGVLTVYGQFKWNVYLVEESSLAEQISKDFTNTANWTQVSFAVEANKTYYLFNENYPGARFVGYTFTRSDAPMTKFSDMKNGYDAITLADDVKYTYDADFTGKVIINRSFEAGSGAYTLCLPFDLSYEDFETCLGSGVKVYKFAELGEGELGFDDVTSGKMAAGFPYIVEFGVNKDYLSFSNVTIAEGASGKGDKGEGTVEIFKGNLQPNRDVTGGYIMNSGDNIVKAESGGGFTRLDAFRGFFDFSGTGRALAPVMRVRLGTNTATGIDEIDGIHVLNIDAPMYNIMGQQVDASYCGVVIQNGHKFMLQ